MKTDENKKTEDSQQKADNFHWSDEQIKNFRKQDGEPIYFEVH